MRLKQELATTAELVNSVLKREQLKREASQQVKAVWEKCEDFASLKCKFPSLLDAEEDEELFYDKERVKKVKPEQVYVSQYFLRECELKTSFFEVALGELSSKRVTTMAILCLRYPTRLLCDPRSALRQSWRKSIGRWPPATMFVTYISMVTTSTCGQVCHGASCFACLRS
jgi:hypothetical protein